LLALITVLACILGVTLLASLASAVAPLRVTCAPALDGQVCQDTVTAARTRGLAATHPLILSAFVEPGEATDPGESGHRATVTFDLLGVPGPTTIRLFYDVGGHWGGVSNRTTLELAVWSLTMAGLVITIVGLVGGAVIVVTGRRRRAPTGGS
jgi:hypothetical protein